MSEQDRLKALSDYKILDTPHERAFDDLAQLAADICQTPIALINLVAESRTWFKAAVGTDARGSERSSSFCSTTIQDNKVLISNDASKDPLFSDNPFVRNAPNARFYAGAPLTTPSGLNIGTICVFDVVPRELSAKQINALETISRTIMSLLENRQTMQTQADASEIVGLVSSIATAANESYSSREGISKCVEAICGFLTAPVGHYFEVDRKDPDALKSSGIWFFDHPERYANFAELTNQSGFRRGVGIPGRALAEAKPIWLGKLDYRTKILRVAAVRDQNLHSLFAFPVMLQGEVVGVFEFFLSYEFEPDAHFLQIISHVTTQISRIIERERAAEVLEKQKEFMEAVLENLSDGVIACDDRGNITLTNRATREFHGFSDSQVVSPLKWPEHYSLYQADGTTPLKFEEVPLMQAFLGGQVKNSEIVIAPNNQPCRHLTTNGRAIFDRAGNKIGAVATLHDVTERKVSQAKLEAVNRTMQTLIDTCPFGILGLDLNVKVTMWSPGCEKLYGWMKEEVLGGPLPFVPVEFQAEAKQMLQEVRRTKSRVSITTERIHKNGKRIYVQIAVMPVLNENSEVQGFIGMIIDISDLKQREAALIGANRLLLAATAAKSEFLANMSHEIRTPLNGVVGMTEIVLGSDLRSDQRSQIEVIQQSAESLLSIVGDILDFSKIEAGKLAIENTSFDLRQVVDDVYRTFEHAALAKGLKLKTQINGEFTNLFMGDPLRIRQVLMNLVNNAIKFTEKGEVRALVSLIPLGNGKTDVRIEVKDSGLGIPNDVKARLFQPFTQADASTTRKFGGTGLGLSICKNIADLMGAGIGVESEVGVGSIFWLKLELENSQPLQPAAIPKIEIVPQVLGGAPVRILLAEDNAINKTIALKMLEKIGLRAVAVENGNAVLNALKSATYDLILMDCQMPELDGYETSRIIRSSTFEPYQNIAIVAMTANAMTGDREKCIDAGMNDYVSKPFKLEDLRRAISRHLKKPPSAAA